MTNVEKIDKCNTKIDKCKNNIDKSKTKMTNV